MEEILSKNLFTVNSVSIPQNLNPIARHCDTDITFTWDPIPQATNYEITISTDADFTEPVAVQEVITDHEYVYTINENQQLWYKIRGFNSVCSSTEAQASVAYPSSIANVSPANGYTHSESWRLPDLVWEGNPDATEYEIEVGTDEDFTTTVFTSITTETSFHPSYQTGIAFGTYYWHVRSTDSATNCGTTWSEAWSFTYSNNEVISTGSYTMNNPTGIVYNPIDDKVYVGDSGNAKIVVFNSNLEYQSNFSSSGSTDGKLAGASTWVRLGSLAVDATGNIWVADAGNDRVQTFDTSGSYLWKTSRSPSSCPSAGSTRAVLSVIVSTNGYHYAHANSCYDDRISSFTNDTRAYGSTGTKTDCGSQLAVNSANTKLYRASRCTGTMTQFDINASGNISSQSNFYAAPSGAASGVFVLPDDNVLVLASNKVIVVAPNGTPLNHAFAITPNNGYNRITVGSEADPYIYVTDFSNHKVYRYNPLPQP